MRGKGFVNFTTYGFERITPAYAGKRLRHIDSVSCHRDHPCICGEKKSISFSQVPEIGSPLHMRGKGDFTRLISGVAGITPAYAGKSVNSVVV